MEGNFYIGAPRRKKRSVCGRITRCLLALLLIALIPTACVHFLLYPQAKALCEAALSNRLEALANEKAYTFLQSGDYAYTDFIHLVYGEDGCVRAATVDTVRLNLLKTSLASAVLSSLHAQSITASVPVGGLTGLLLLSGRGEDVHVNARVAEGMRARFHTAFTDAGINQTRHAIGFSLDFSATYILASRVERLSFSLQIPIGETLIVGAVPDNLTQINRLSDDVTEIEIDDAVDFGGILS